jgi:hypothetical protein
MKGRSCTDNVHVIKHLTEKHREFNQEVHILFTDYVMAFNNINSQVLWNILHWQGIPQFLTEVVKFSYNLKISIEKATATAFTRKHPIRLEFILENQVTE